MSGVKPYREQSEGTYALERGIRRNTPKPPPPEAAHASAAQQPFTTASLRPVVSKFGGMVMESHAVHIPQQAGGVSVGAADDDFDYESRCKPSVTNVYAGIPGYTGYKPHGAHHSVLGNNDNGRTKLTQARILKGLGLATATDHQSDMSVVRHIISVQS